MQFFALLGCKNTVLLSFVGLRVSAARNMGSYLQRLSTRSFPSRTEFKPWLVLAVVCGTSGICPGYLTYRASGGTSLISKVFLVSSCS